jgi:hypothetical protein
MGLHPIIGLPPAAAGLQYFLDGWDLDNQGNGSLVDGQTLTTITNKGLRGGSFTPMGGVQAFDGTNRCVKFNGAGGLHTSVGSLLAQPMLFCEVFMLGGATSGAFGFDGADATHRIRTVVTSTSVQTLTSQGGSTISFGSAVTLNKWYIHLARADGSSSYLDVNDPNAHSVSGDIGSSGITGMAVGADPSNAAPLPNNSRVAVLLAWQGTLPAEQDVLDWIYTRYMAGWGAQTSGRLKSILEPIGFGPPSPTPTLNIVGGDILDFYGNSLTAGSGGIRWQAPAEVTINLNVAVPCVFLQDGHSGATVAQLITLVDTIIAHDPQPTKVVIECEINDMSTGVPVRDFIDDCATLISLIQAGIPGVDIAWLSALAQGEKFPDPLFARIQQYVQALHYQCGESGVTFVPIRDVQQEYENEFNVAHPGNAFSPGPPPDSNVLLTIDGVHPGVDTNGAPVMSDAFISRCTFSG